MMMLMNHSYSPPKSDWLPPTIAKALVVMDLRSQVSCAILIKGTHVPTSIHAMVTAANFFEFIVLTTLSMCPINEKAFKELSSSSFCKKP